MATTFESLKKVEFFSSGSMLLDCILGGGWAVGRIVNIVGDKSSGKSLLAAEAIKNFCVKYPDGKLWYSDVERALDPEHLVKLKVPQQRVELIKMATVEDFFNHLDGRAQALSHNTQGLFIVDSLDALSDQAELERGIEEGSYNMQKAKKLSELFRRANQIVESKAITVMVISQTRDEIGAMFAKKTRSGGKALEFYCSQIVWMHEKGKIERTVQQIKRPIGIKVKAKCEKNKVGEPFRDCELQIIFSRGIDDLGSNLEFLEKADALKEVAPIETQSPSTSISTFIKKARVLPYEEFLKVKANVAAITLGTWQKIEAGFETTENY